MYETIYYNVVEYGDDLRKKEDCIFGENFGHWFSFHLKSTFEDDFQCSKAEKWQL